MDLVREAEKVLADMENLKRILVQTFQDVDTLSHDTRWEHYLAWYTLGGNTYPHVWDGWNNIIPKHEEPMMYGGIVPTERYQTVDLVSALDGIMEYLVCDEESELSQEFTKLEAAGYDDPFTILNNCDIMVKLKEALMLGGISAVHYNW